MMWSRTSTAYTGIFLGLTVVDALAQDRTASAQDGRQPRRQVRKCDRRLEQDVQPVVGEQTERMFETAARAPLPTMRGRNLADLARDQPKPTAMERAAQRHRNRRVAIPAQLDDGGFVAGRRQRRRQPRAAGAGVKDQPALRR